MNAFRARAAADPRQPPPRRRLPRRDQRQHDPARLEIARVRTPLGDIAVARAGDPDAQPVVMLHGLGGTKGSFLPTVAALADAYRTLSIDLPGFGDSVKPVGAAYDPRFFAKAVCGFMDASASSAPT